MKTIYTADWILPVSDKPQRNGAFLVEDGIITDMGHAFYLSRKHQIKPQRFAGSVVVPSWVNAHCHLELSYLKNMVLHGNHFVSWIDSLIQAREEHNDAQKIDDAFQRELQLQSETGTSLIADVSNGQYLNQNKSGPERVIYYELLGFPQDRAEEIYQRAVNVVKSNKNDIRLSPHALYSSSADLVKRILSGKKYASIHVAESPVEMIFLLDGSGPFQSFLKKRNVWRENWQAPGQSPIEYLHNLEVLSKELLLVHGVHVNQRDMAMIKKAGTTVCLCLRSNLALGSGLPPVIQYLNNEIPLCVGTDSLASNSDLDMNEEVAYLTECFPQVNPQHFLQMATINGAVALGKDAEYGSLEIGKKACFNVFSGAKLKEMEPEMFVVSKSWSDLICF